MTTPIPADPPIGGALWEIVVPALLLAFSSLATWLLYRHFAGAASEEGAASDRDRS